MKLQGRAIAGFLRQPDRAIRIALVYGPDAGLVDERAELIAKAIADDVKDPFRVVQLTTGNVTSDPARLADELAAISFTGGRRLVRIREADDSCAAAVSSLIKDMPPGDGFLLLEAGDLAQRSKLRTAVEAAETAAALPCYVEDEASLSEVIGGLLAEHRLRVDNDALTFLAGQLVGDRRVARNEVEKLVTYAGTAGTLSLDEVRACIGDSAALDPSDAVLAAADGDFRNLDRALGRLFGEGTSPVAILRMAQRHFQRLQTAAAAVAGGKSPDAAIAALKPPVFFKEKPRFTRQLRQWPPGAIAAALHRLLDAEADVKKTNMPDQTICARVLFQLASMARR